MHRTKEGCSSVYEGDLVDVDGTTPIPLSAISTITLTLYNADVREPSPTTGNIINSRNQQNVKNANDVTIHNTSGHITWNMSGLDNPIIDETKSTEKHIALFEFTYTSGSVQKDGKHKVEIRVENLRKV